MEQKLNKKEILEVVQEELINDLGQYIESLGGKTLLGRIWGLLLTSPEPVSLKEMTNRLNVSKPAISATVNMGLQYGVFSKVYNPKFPRENIIKLNIDSMEMLIAPGMKKLSTLFDKFSNASKRLEEKANSKYNDTGFDIIEQRLMYLTESYKIFLDEYKKMAQIVIDKIKPLEEELKKGGIL
jgi:DNA-binding transcriptional regulator GbsR (MarR family)